MTSGIMQYVLDIAASKFGKDFLSSGKVPVLGRHELTAVIFSPYSIEFTGKLVPHITHHFKQISLVISAFVRIRCMGVVRQIIKNQVLKDGTDIETHRAKKCELGINYPGVGFIDHNAARVQVAMNKGLTVGHETFFHLGQRQFELAVCPHSLYLCIDLRVPLIICRFHIWIRKNKILLNLTHMRIDKLGLKFLFLHSGQVEI